MGWPDPKKITNGPARPKKKPINHIGDSAQKCVGPPGKCPVGLYQMAIPALDIAYRERTPKSIYKISEKFKEMDDIKLILEVEKHRELYDPQQQFYKDNVG